MGKQHDSYIEFYRTANELHYDGDYTTEIEDIANRLELYEITPEQALTELNRIRLQGLFEKYWKEREDDSPEELAGK